MYTQKQNWLDSALVANSEFQNRIRSDHLPTRRIPGTVAVLTCMDPRINLEAIGIPQFEADGKGESSVRVIRTIGAMADDRSLIIGIFLAGIREIAVLMHSDCGCSVAYTKIDTIIENMRQNLAESELNQFRKKIGEPFRENLRNWLKAFKDPYEAACREALAIKALPFAPRDLVVHGLVYELATGKVNVVVNGYEDADQSTDL